MTEPNRGAGPEFTPGDRVRLIATDDPYTRLTTGATGTVTSVRQNFDGLSVGVKWDDGSTLAMLTDAGDRIETLPTRVT